MVDKAQVTRTIDRLVAHIVIHEDGDLSFLEQECFNEATPTEPAGYGKRRIAGFHDGEWCFVGIYLSVVDEAGYELGRSAGLWGMESDSGSEYFDQVAADDREEFEKTLGVDLSAYVIEWSDPGGFR